MLVFREGRRTVPGPALCDQFRVSLDQLSSSASPDKVLDALLRAGELECALADAESPLAVSVAATTDALAAWLVNGRPPGLLNWSPDACAAEPLTFSRPEGFAYYALHPLDYAEAIGCIPRAARDVAVIGIRSIGTTLSAVVAAAAGRRTPARRISVRPSGHPFDRVLHFSPLQTAWIATAEAADAHFVVVDEGPGLSGSSFLAVAEALVRAGIPESRITLLGSNTPNFETLRAPRAAERWARFHFLAIQPPWRKPADAAIALGQGRWRELLRAGSAVPASWICFERQKYLSRDGRHLFKFEGLGPYGEEVLERAQALAAANFSPAVSPLGEGFLRYEWRSGRSPDPRHVTAAELDRIADYCTWRVAAFSAPSPNPLESMLLTNLKEEFGDAATEEVPAIEYRRVAVVDGRMHPHEWLCAGDGRLIKVDSATHGDDHFFPGPADIAWDLAGMIVEWDLSGEAAQYFIGCYARASGDDPRSRLPAYLLAYTMFRLGYCRMAAESMIGSEEALRFQREANYYRGVALEQLRRVPRYRRFAPQGGEFNAEPRKGGLKVAPHEVPG